VPFDKCATCQILVSLALAKDDVPKPVGGRPRSPVRASLPEAWTVDTARCAEAGIPAEHQRALAKTGSR
jgi:hypothetical protein